MTDKPWAGVILGWVGTLASFTLEDINVATSILAGLATLVYTLTQIIDWIRKKRKK